MAPPLQPRFDQLAQEGRRNWVLNLNELAVGAMRNGNHDIARRALDESLLEINAVFGTTAEAVKARTIFFNEDVKLYKGDPYERVMAFLYRGILYMMDGDYENARACFRSGLQQDAFAEEEQFRADWVTLEYLIAVCEAQLDRPFFAEEAYKRAAETYGALPEGLNALREKDRQGSPSGLRVALMPEAGGAFPLPLPTREHNLLVLAQSGTAPQKMRSGRYGQYLVVGRGNPGSMPGIVMVCGQEFAAPQTDSVYFQAATRGGRPFDALQGRKVAVKKTSEVVGTAGLYSGAFVLATSDSEGQATLGLILLAVGLVATGFSFLVATRADTRDWESLPDALGTALLQTKCAGPQTLDVRPGNARVARQQVVLPKAGEGLCVVLAFPGPQPALLVSPNSLPKGPLPP